MFDDIDLQILEILQKKARIPNAEVARQVNMAPSAVLERLIDLAVGIAVDGWEGRPLGTLLVVGDTAAVLEKSKQLTLNPFQGYSESEKNILDPEVRNAIRKVEREILERPPLRYRVELLIDRLDQLLADRSRPQR